MCGCLSNAIDPGEEGTDTNLEMVMEMVMSMMLMMEIAMMT